MSSKTLFALVSAVAVGTFLSAPAYALSLGDFNPIKAATKIVTAPIATAINVVNVVVDGASAKTILDPAKDAARTVAPLPTLVANVATWPQAQIFKEAQTLAEKTGKTGEFVFDVATFTQRYQDAAIQSMGASAANVLLGKNPLEFVAMPLAAAIREARARHIKNAKPLPADVRKALGNFFAPDVLDRAKYTVGTVEITLPNGIGKVHKFFGNDYAVVVDDVIVFPKDPGSFKDNPQWWGHEMTHVQQYKQWGIDEFAFRYVKSVGDEAEDPAIARGNEVFAWAGQNFRSSDGALLALVIDRPHLQAVKQYSPLLPAAYAKIEEERAGTQAQSDPPILRCFFPGDSLEYYGTRSGRIIAVDANTRQWMHIGWAAPPDISGPAWVYFIPGRGSYDVLPAGQIMQRYGPRLSPYGPPGPPVQVGHVARLQ